MSQCPVAHPQSAMNTSFSSFCERQAPDGACRDVNFSENKTFKSLSVVCLSVCLYFRHFRHLLNGFKWFRGDPPQFFASTSMRHTGTSRNDEKHFVFLLFYMSFLVFPFLHCFCFAFSLLFDLWDALGTSRGVVWETCWDIFGRSSDGLEYSNR